MDKIANSVIMGGIALTTIVFLLCCTIWLILYTAKLVGKAKKPPCKHNLIVCDHKRLYSEYDITRLYYVACTECGRTNWVEEYYLDEMANLGMYKETNNH